MLVNAFLMITMISICYFKTAFLPLMMYTPCFGVEMRCPWRLKITFLVLTLAGSWLMPSVTLGTAAAETSLGVKKQEDVSTI